MNKEIIHLACIMDGNRRWAKRQGLLPWYGHREGMEAVRTVIDFCLEKQIRFLSLYTFSLENFKRPEPEKRYLFSYLAKQAEKEVDQFIAKGVQVHFIGDRTQFPESMRPVCELAERKTANCKRLCLNLLFCYGGRQELVASVKNIVHDVKAGKLTEDKITEELINQYLWTGSIPAPDLIIRTGGMRRLSNFLLYQAAYSELCFLDCMWPDMTKVDLENVLNSFKEYKRNFGI
ncbi:di-trans,poly-cis-decaprenylcistransferase [Candidatus Dependentiae bacterium]|nr:MAG: di-trans,poly-cis-decaprenylcistransferase [Candidatus Dependentiae bacterium]